jgi:hypothetical protein
MNVVRYPTDRLANLLRDQKIATMSQLKVLLGCSGAFLLARLSEGDGIKRSL